MQFIDPIFDSTIILSEDVTFAIVNTPSGIFTSIEMTKSMMQQDVFFTIYCLEPQAITLYNNKSLTKTLENCFTTFSPYKCIIKESSFVLYQSDIAISAIELSRGSKNCVFKNSIFGVHNVATFPISALASTEGSCLLTVLIGVDEYIISHLWTTSIKENVKVFVGNDQTKLFFEFNSETKDKWKNILLTSVVYTILVPKAATLYITLKFFSQGFLLPPSYPYLSLFTTPFYGCFKDSTFVEFLRIMYHIKENPIKFTVLNYTYSEDNLVWYTIGEDDDDDADIVHNFINKTGDSMIFKNQNVTWWCVDANGNPENGAMFLIETYNFDIEQ